MPKDALCGMSKIQTALENGPVPRDGPIATRGNGEEGIAPCILLLAQGILRCLCSETTMCFLFPRIRQSLGAAVSIGVASHKEWAMGHVRDVEAFHARLSCVAIGLSGGVCPPLPSVTGLWESCHGVVGELSLLLHGRLGRSLFGWGFGFSWGCSLIAGSVS